MATVTVPSEFFRAELRVYADWREAFARELLQNALDARPSSIDIRFFDRDGHGWICFSDDGTGMSRSVLEEVFFALGKTTKDTPESIGGFGRARIIICFAQSSYEIRTGGLLVQGAGGEYSVGESSDHVRGCVFQIELVDVDHTKVKRAFLDLLRGCDLPVPVRLDGPVVAGTPLPERATRVLRDEEGRVWARVYVEPGKIGRLLVRVRGLTMYSRWLPGSDDVTVELTPARSREVLSASRDRLVAGFADQVDAFVVDLSSNRRRALHSPGEPLDVRVGGGGFLRTGAAPEPPVEGAAPELAPGTEEGADLPAGGRQAHDEPANEAARRHMSEAATSESTAEAEPRNQGRGLRSTLDFDVYLLADARDRRVRRLVKTWDPSFWDERVGRRRRALLYVWRAAVANALELLVRCRPEVSQVLWTVGWVFDAESCAVHKRVAEGHVLALNPADGAGQARYRVSRRADRRRISAIALHEAAHVAVEGHDESFAALLTQLCAELDQDAADRLMREAARGA